MKTKTNITKAVRSINGKERNYPAFYLAVLLAAVLLLEGFLLGAATPSAWQEGLQILDVSRGVSAVMNDSYLAIEPMMDQIQNVQIFYQMATTEAFEIFDSSYVDPLAFPKSVISFYQIASIEMEQMLDFSNQFAYFPQVAGASISR